MGVLSLQTRSKRNAWYELTNLRDDAAGFRRDLLHVIDSIWSAIVERHAYSLLGPANRLLLMLASINSLAAQVPPSVALALYRLGTWSASRLITHAYTIPAASSAAYALVQASVFAQPRDVALIIGTAFERLGEIEEEEERADVIALLASAPAVKGAWRENLITHAGSLEIHYYRAIALAAIAKAADEPENSVVLRNALEAARQVKDSYRRAEVIYAVISATQNATLKDVLSVVRTLPLEKRALALVELATRECVGEYHDALVNEAIVSGFQLAEGKRAYVLGQVARWLNTTQLAQLLARRSEFGTYPDEGVAGAALRLVELGSVQSAIELVPLITDTRYQVAILTASARYLDEAQLEKALGIANGITYLGDREKAFAALVPQLSRFNRFPEAIAYVSSIQAGEMRNKALAQMAAHLDEYHLEFIEPFDRGNAYEALDWILMLLIGARQEIRQRIVLRAVSAESPHRLIIFDGLIEALCDRGHFDNSILVLNAVASDDVSVRVLAYLGRRAPSALVDDIVRRATAIRDDLLVLPELVNFVATLSGSAKNSAALVLLGHLLGAYPNVSGLAKLAAHLPTQIARDTFNKLRLSAQAIQKQDPNLFFPTKDADAALLLRMAQSGDVNEAVDLLRLVGELDVCDILATIADSVSGDIRILITNEQLQRECLPDDELVARAALDHATAGNGTEALQVVRRIGLPYSAGRTLERLVPYLNSGVLSDFIALCQSLEAHGDDALAAFLATKGPTLPLDEWLHLWRTLRDTAPRIRAAVGLASLSNGARRDELISTALSVAHELSANLAADALKGLLPKVASLGRQSLALSEAAAIQYDEQKGTALAGIAPFLPDAMLDEAISIAMAVRDVHARALALVALCRSPARPPFIAAAETIGQIDWPERRAEVLRQFSTIAALDVDMAIPTYRALLHRLSLRSRRDVVSDLAALAPLTAAIGGEVSVEETFYATIDVMGWWA